MYFNQKNYLKLCGFKLNKDKTSVCLNFPINSFYPKLSCKVDPSEGYIFVLHFSPDDGFARSEISFSFDEAPLVRSKFKDSLFLFFSIPDSFLKKVRKSRSNGQKHWKIRNFPLPFKKAKILSAFGIVVEKDEVDEGADGKVVAEERVDGGVGVVKGKDVIEGNAVDNETKAIAKRNMDICVKKAAANYDLNLFDLYYDAWKDFYGSSSKSNARKQFYKEVRALQS